MRNLLIFFIAIYSFSIKAQQSEKFQTNAEGTIQVFMGGGIGLAPNNVTWSMSTYFVNNKEVSRVFYLPKSNVYDISLGIKTLPNTNGTNGLYISSKDNLKKFAEALIYFGEQKGKKTENMVIDSAENIDLGLKSPFPNHVLIGSKGIFITRKNAIKLGEAILENIIYF